MSDHTLEFHSTAPESPHGRVRENSMSMREIRESDRDDDGE